MKPMFNSYLNCKITPMSYPPQHQCVKPGIESIMVPKPISEDPNYKGVDKLKDKVAIITGGDSGIGRAVAISFAKEGADVVVVYLREYENFDACETKKRVNELGRECHLIQGDVKSQSFCNQVATITKNKFGHIDILVNNAGIADIQPSISCISPMQLENTFRTNVFSYFYMVKAVLPFLKRGDAIINDISVTAYEGYDTLIDYSSSKGALVTFTNSLSQSLIKRGIRVNGVAPGMTWTPLIPSTLSAKDVSTFGTDRPMGRAAQPYEIAPSFVFLASNIDSSYITGQVIIVT